MAESIIELFRLVLLQFAFCSILNQKDGSIPSQVPRNNTTWATRVCLL